MNVRAEAVNLLKRWEKGGVFAETLIEDCVREMRMDSSDRAFLTAMVMGVLRNKTWLDELIDSLRQGGKLQSDLRHILRLGLCQLLILNLSPHAAVNETVELAQKRASGLVNALLRRAERERNSIWREWQTLPLHIKYSTPEWLVNRWEEHFGHSVAEALLSRQQEIPVLYARRNEGTPLPEGELPEGMEELADLPGWYRVKGRLPMEALRAGAFYMTDPSTRHAVELLAPRPGEKILDACAAPGGKSAAISSLTGGEAILMATDLGEHRLPRLRQNLEQWGGKNFQVQAFDWTHPCPDQWIAAYDGVLLDVPCSNTGVMQRRVDVRWRLTEQEMDRLVNLQSSILNNACLAVRQDGRLVYSTCSIDPEEDSRVVQKFLTAHPDWKLEEERLILPHDEETDGAYAAKLIRA